MRDFIYSKLSEQAESGQGRLLLELVGQSEAAGLFEGLTVGTSHYDVEVRVRGNRTQGGEAKLVARLVAFGVVEINVGYVELTSGSSFRWAITWTDEDVDSAARHLRRGVEVLHALSDTKDADLTLVLQSMLQR